MIRTVAVGLWAAVVAILSTYAAATWSAGGSVALPADESALDGLEYRKPGPLTVPMIADGRLRGYVVAKVVFTARAGDLREFPVDPNPFVTDAAFREIYTNGRVEFDQLSKYNLAEITGAIKESVNKRLGFDLLKDVLLEEISYVPKDAMTSE
ncbi:MAG TPA: hypothetical protein PKA74_19465 [Bauldia sp.]|nr:hypothetical protein [Bauldia sp.]